MSDELRLDNILTVEKVPMSIAEKLKAKREADEEKMGMKIPDKPSPIVDKFIELDVTPGDGYQADPDVIAAHALDLYRSYKGEVSGTKRFIELLEEGRILLPYGIIDDEDLANAILIKVIEISADEKEPNRETASVFAPENIEIENKELHLADAYEQEVHDAIDKYADTLLADSVTMFAEAMNFDPRFCDVIVRGDTQFFREVEDMGFPTLALMVKNIQASRSE